MADFSSQTPSDSAGQFQSAGIGLDKDMKVLDSPRSFVKHAVSADQGSNRSLDTSDTYSETSLLSTTSSSDELPAPNHPFYKLPTHPLILPTSVLNRKVKPVHFQEVWDVVNVKPFIMEVMGVIPTTHDYHEGIHLCRTIFVNKYGFGRYMDNMQLFWGMFHETYVGRNSDPHSASWSRWRYDRKVELEHVLCHSYVWISDDGGSYLEEYINFKPGEPDRTFAQDHEYFRRIGAKVTRFEIGWIGIEKCNPDWDEDNLRMCRGLERRSFPPISSTRLSSDFALSTKSIGSTNDVPPFLAHVVNEQTSALQWESANHTYALNVFAARKHRTLSQNARTGLRQELDRAFSIHRSHSVWKEAKQLLLQRSHSSKKRVVSGPVHVTRGPSLGVTLLPIASPAPELARTCQEGGTLQSNHAQHLSNISLSDTEVPFWRPVALLPQSFQGSLYGQLEDLLVIAGNKFLKYQISNLTEESIMKELGLMERGNDGWTQTSESSDKTWFRQLRGRIASIGKTRNYHERRGSTLFHSQHEWGVISSYRLIHANVESLQFHGDCATSPAIVLGLWGRLISQAFSGRRTKFDDSTVMRHLDHVESILALLGNLVILRELKKKTHDIRMLLKQSRSVSSDLAECTPSFSVVTTPQRRASIPPSVGFPPTRSSSLPRPVKENRPRSLNGSMNAVWNELGGTYATTPSLPPLDVEHMKDSPCYGRGKGKGRARASMKCEEFKPVRTTSYEPDKSLDRETEDAWNKENERANALQTLVGKQLPVPGGTIMGAGTRKEVRFRDKAA